MLSNGSDTTDVTQAAPTEALLDKKFHTVFYLP
jgi:hypothetical protein